MPKFLRHRTLLILITPLSVLALMWLLDPDNGANVKVWIERLLSAYVLVGLAHWVRKAYFDYPESDVRSLFARASGHPIGAGLALIAVSIFLFAVLMLFAGRAGAAQDPELEKAKPYLPMLHEQIERNWADHPRPEILAALAGHESGCMSMPHKCWNPKSRLKTSREEGAGFGQITRAFRPDGSVRFDALEDLRQRHPVLADWSWNNVYGRPDYQLAAMVLMSHDNFRALAAVRDPQQRLLFADAAYNGGLGGVRREREICNQVPGCDPQKWYGNVEAHCSKSTAALYGTRSACDINRFHVRDVDRRARKYAGLV